MGESGDKKGIKREISSHGGQVWNAWPKRIVRRNWGYKGRIVYLRVLRRGEESLFPISSSFFFLKMKYDDCIIRSMDVTKELKNKKKDFEQSSIEEYIYRCMKRKEATREIFRSCKRRVKI